MRRKHTVIQAFLTLTLVVGIAHGQDREKPSARSAHAQADLQEQVRHELATLPNSGVFDWVEAEVREDGTVILNGDVTRPTIKADAEVNIMPLTGVTRISNNIDVLPVSDHDAELRSKVYQAIYASDGPLAKYATLAVGPIHIIVKNGDVTLKGVVDNQGDSDIALLKAQGVSGAFSVKNELMVAEGGEQKKPITQLVQ